MEHHYYYYYTGHCFIHFVIDSDKLKQRRRLSSSSTHTYTERALLKVQISEFVVEYLHTTSSIYKTHTQP